MRKEKCLLLMGLVAFASTSIMANKATAQNQGTRPSQGILFTTPLLSDEEQSEYRARVRAAKDVDKVERIRTAHYELMKARASERGVVLPENRPPAFGVEGNAFGPQLITEEERAAKRARVRAGRDTQTPVTIAPARKEQVDLSIKSATTTRLADVPVSPATLPTPAPSATTTAAVPSSTAAVQQSPAIVPPPSASMVLPGIESIFGSQLMTEEEKAAFRARLRSAKTDEERQKIRAEREQQLRTRTKDRGLAPPQ